MKDNMQNACNNCGYKNVCHDYQDGNLPCRYYMTQEFRTRQLWNFNDVDLKNMYIAEHEYDHKKATGWLIIDAIAIAIISGINLQKLGVFRAVNHWFTTTLMPFITNNGMILRHISLAAIAFAILCLLINRTLWSIRTLRKYK